MSAEGWLFEVNTEKKKIHCRQ